MGNCLVVQENIIKVMKSDGEVLEYEAPMQVHQVLSQFSDHHTISDTLTVVRHLRLDSELLGGHLYYLLLPQVENKNKLRYSSPVVVEGGQGKGVVRIKMVISKQELEAMLRNGGDLSSNDMVSQLLMKKPCTTSAEDGDGRGWKPSLESIPEAN